MSAAKPSPETSADICPYWHEVTADFISMYPAGGYCIAGCHMRIKVMGEKTFNEVCAMNFAECEGYHRLLAEEEARQRQTPETFRR
jgi:hypothetical protein